MRASCRRIGHRGWPALVAWLVLGCSDRESELGAAALGSGGERGATRGASSRSATGSSGICCLSTTSSGAGGANGGSLGAGGGGTGETVSGGAAGLGGEAGDDSGGSGGVPVGCTRDSECAAKGACVRAACEEGQCVAAAMKDGTPCDDENVCTGTDRCLAGMCSGEPRASEPAVVGWLPLFGGLRHEDPNGLQGLVEVLGGDHVVFLERMNQGAGRSMLVLGSLSASGIELLDYAFSPLRLHTQAVVGGGLDWTNRLFGHIVPMGGSRFAFVAAQAGIEVYEIKETRLVLLSSTELPRTGGLLSGAATSGGRLFTCKPLVQSFEIREDGSLGAEEIMNVSCDTLASDPRDDRLFVSDSLHGLSALDTSSDTPVVIQQNEAISQLESLSAGLDYVGGVELQPAGAAGSVVVVRADDLSLVGRLDPMDDAWPTGVAFRDNDLFVQWRRGTDTECELSVARYQVSSDSIALQQHQRVRGVSCRDLSRRTTSPVRVSLSGQWLAMQPFRDVLHVTADGAALITGPLHGAAERLLPLGSGLFDALGPDSAHRIDTSDAAHPVAVVGGRMFDQALDSLRVLVAPAATELMNVPLLNTPIEQQEARTALTRLVAGASIPPEISGRLLLDGGPAKLAFAGEALFQIRDLDETRYQLRRFGPASGLRGAGDAELVPDLDALLSFEAPTELSARVYTRFFPTAEGHAIIVLEQREAEGSQRQPRLGLFELGQGEPVLAAQGELTRAPALAAGAGSKLLVVAYDAVQLLEVKGGSFQVAAEWIYPPDSTVERILSWDGDRARLATWTWVGSELTAGVLVLSGTDLSELARYETHDEVLSLSMVEENLVFAMKNGITIASPACP